MNDLETFRAALQAPTDAAHGALDLDRIMQQGGRLRRRRRLLAGAAGLATALVLVTGGVQAGRAFAPPAPGVSVAAPGPSRGDTSGEDVTDVVRTGVQVGERELVLYLAPVDDPALPEVDFGVVAGVRAPDGGVTSRVLSNETEGPWRAPGFHAVSGAMNIAGDDIPAFGYYVGPAAKITAGKGEKVTARQARWIGDPSIVLFWFDPADVPDGFRVSSLTAYDKDGDKLKTGNNAVGVG
jgi:hypothetical protein